MSTSVRRRTAKIVLAFSILGGAALAANTALLSPTADGGLPGPIIEPGKPPITIRTPDTVRPDPFPTVTPSPVAVAN